MIDPATNRLLGGQQYDANGNNTTKPGWGATLGYNSDNRLVSYETPSSGSEYYAYSPFGQMVYRRKVTSETKEYVLFYGVDGQRRVGRACGRRGICAPAEFLRGLRPRAEHSSAPLAAPDSVHFLGKRIRPKDLGSSSPKVESWVADRVGSEVSYYSGYGLAPAATYDHYPYGEQRNGGERSPTYATYLGNTFNGLDYARMRHYTRAAGRFMTPDPYGGSASLTDSQSWNRYAYVGGDPVNHNDPCGLLPANVYFEGPACALGGLVAQPGGIDASNPCPPGYTMVWGGPGVSSKSRLRQVMEIFDPLAGIIEDWNYANQYGTAFDITLPGDLYHSMVSTGAIQVGTAGTGVIGGVLIQITVTGTAILTSPVTITVASVAAAAAVGYVIYEFAKQTNHILEAAKEQVGYRGPADKEKLCQLLREWYENARSNEEKLRIKAAQKYANCRRTHLDD